MFRSAYTVFFLTLILPFPSFAGDSKALSCDQTFRRLGPKPVLVTGGTGLVGNNVVRELLARGVPVRALVRNHDPRIFAGLDVDKVSGDLRDIENIPHLLDGVSGVIHSAAIVHIGWRKLKEMTEVNVDATQKLGELARQKGLRFVQVSSVDALGLNKNREPADESTKRVGKDLNSYVFTKQKSEAVIRDLVENGLDATIVNPSFMLGPWDWAPSSGRMLLQVGQKFTPLAIAGGMTLADVRDVSKGILAAFERGKTGENYILGGYYIEYLKAWQKFSKMGNSMAPIRKLPPWVANSFGRVGDLIGLATGEGDLNSAATRMGNQYHYHSSKKAKRELGYENRPIDDTISDAWNWFRHNGYLRKDVVQGVDIPAASEQMNIKFGSSQ